MFKLILGVDLRSESFALEDRRGGSGYAHWDENLKQYEEYRAQFWPEET